MQHIPHRGFCTVCCRLLRFCTGHCFWTMVVSQSRIETASCHSDSIKLCAACLWVTCLMHTCCEHLIKHNTHRDDSESTNPLPNHAAAPKSDAASLPSAVNASCRRGCV
jgi:hypothetical protein